MTDTVTVAITLPINGTSLERAQALVAAMQNPATGSIGAYAIGQLLSDMRAYAEPAAPVWAPQEIRFYGK